MVTLEARELMTPALSCLDQSDTVVQAARRMRALGVSLLPVACRAGGFLGMVLERDIVERCVAAAADPRVMPVGTLLRTPQAFGAGRSDG